MYIGLYAMVKCRYVGWDSCEVGNREFDGIGQAAEFGEVEPFPAGRVIIGRGSIIDAVVIKLSPRSQK